MPRGISRPAKWLLVVGWACVIFYMSSRTGDSLPSGLSVQGHAVEYFVLAALLVWSLAEENVPLSTILFAVLLASLYGVTDEYHQHFVAGRVPDMADWLTDTLAATAGAFLVRAVLARSARKRLEQSSASGG